MKAILAKMTPPPTNTITTLQKQYKEETHNIYKKYKTKTYDIKHNRYTYEHCYNKQQTVNNSITNNISNNNNNNNISNELHALNL